MVLYLFFGLASTTDTIPVAVALSLNNTEEVDKRDLNQISSNQYCQGSYLFLEADMVLR
jgi:hypothetical protein